MKKKFKCNSAVEECIKWLKKNKDKIHDGGLSAVIELDISGAGVLEEELVK